MKLDRLIRIVVALAILVAFLVATGAVLFVTESALNVRDRLEGGPRWILWAYGALLAAVLLAAVALTWRLVVRRPRGGGRVRPRTLTREEIEGRLAGAERAGVDVGTAQAELRELALRQQSRTVHLCFFGTVSTGKSSLIKALVPDADVRIDVVGGSTENIRHYRWRGGEGTEILLTDVPGTSGHEAALSDVALEEARRAHIVLFVCGGDLTRAEIAAVRELAALDKPMILVMNKSDRYSANEQARLLHRLLERLEAFGGELSRDRVVAVSAGGETDVVVRGPDGRETPGRRQRPADIGVLVVAINRLLEAERAPLDDRRDRAVFQLAAEKLAAAEAAYREQRAEQVIRSSTRKAIIGALAAISPGTDILIQGFIGTAMTRELCKLYGAAPRDLDVEEFLNLSQSRVGRALPLTLAVAGNALKAFPGVGTVAGGFVHAVAYGLIFDALGRSLVVSLRKHGELVPDVAAREFEDNIGEYVEAGVKRVARMALEEKTGGG
ncbi:MAG TPA: GTPase [Woeseiaceae bacterium]|nr:GTPase [Woeseiaceae bacterium]